MNIINEIDSLIDEQLAGGEARTGFDYGDPQFPKCWHCGRHWHGLPITERIVEMYVFGRFDEGYRAEADTSRVLCQGSEFIGPMALDSGVRRTPTVYGSAWIDVGVDVGVFMARQLAGVQEMRTFRIGNAVTDGDMTTLTMCEPGEFSQ